jgi:sugar O-acyltransferase (sialic acid O-acetyltransferase NeuD family)
MSRPIVIFGAGDFPGMLAHLLTNDTGREVAAFTVDAAYIDKDSHYGLPLVPFETLTELYPPESHEILVAVGYSRMNALRQERLSSARQKGYRAAQLVAGSASVWPGTAVKGNTLLFEQCVLQSYVQMGENVILRAGSIIGHHSVVGSHSFIASRAVTGGHVRIGERSFIGLGAVLRDGVSIGDRCFVGAGAVVLSDTEPDSVYVGNPAKRLKKRSMDVT